MKEAFLMQETVDREATKLIRKCRIFCNPVGFINICNYTNPVVILLIGGEKLTPVR